MKELNEGPVIVIDGQTNVDLESEIKEIQEEKPKNHPQIPRKPGKYILTKGDKVTVKFAKGLILSNLIGFVFLFVGCAIIYTTLKLNWYDEMLVSFQIFIFSDVLLIGEKILFFAALINKKKIVKLCPFLNVLSLLLKIVASGLIVHMIPCALAVSLALMLIQMPHNIMIKVITKRWRSIPERKWKKQLVLVRKPIPQK
ncbi:unnamed protein product (macronuclear) [Paramecium tetraurelia]|uniref:Cation-transporting P-type ATPase C-terminal domain-containing protein n=1 Tax=Paramecium tetraurelia TaxID=5888 RepID=A0EDC3_PARTE|nr:uncharacterized protein GSPATT00004159001 [Paramecium tetraurelia]CAK93290.1 unnamed protein product [Paramecium tetraurelia]|eukprot:XP_001460687.1 hypothetical protein (macronuclear) [Paramecium tetraurelia strain d4-2]